MGQETKAQGIVTKLASGIAGQAWVRVGARGRGREKQNQGAVGERTSYKGQWPAVAIHPEVQ